MVVISLFPKCDYRNNDNTVVRIRVTACRNDRRNCSLNSRRRKDVRCSSLFLLEIKNTVRFNEWFIEISGCCHCRICCVVLDIILLSRYVCHLNNVLSWVAWHHILTQSLHDIGFQKTKTFVLLQWNSIPNLSPK